MASLESGYKEQKTASEVLEPAPVESLEGTSEEIILDSYSGILGRLRYYEAVFDKKLGVEAHGPRRILPHEKKPPNTWVMFAMWGSSGVYTLGGLTLGFIGWEYGLGIKQTIPIMMFASLVGCAVAGWCASLGPGTGLRQVAISRYSFGWWPSKLVALLNIVEQIGWSAVGCITGGQALSAVSYDRVSIILGIVIIAVLSVICSFGGYGPILMIERYWWIPFMIIFLVIYGEVGGYTDKSPASVSGMTFSGACLDLFAIMYGNGSSWCSIISDYYVHYPVNTSKTKVWLLTTFGLWIPMNLGSLVGVLIASTMNVNKAWLDAYDNNGTGGLILQILHPLGFAKFILVILSLAGVGLNTMAIYSAALAIQQAAKPLQTVPRFIWTLIVFLLILLLSVIGRASVSDFLSNMLSLLGYYNTCFFVILWLEHYYFRRGSFDNYDLEGWDTASRLPIGFAGFGAFLCGWAGAILGMDETYYIGVLANKIGDYGGDIGNQLALVFAVIAYIPLRTLELKYFHR